MKPAAPVTTAFTAAASAASGGSRRGLPRPSTAAWAVMPVASGAASASRRTSYSNATRAPDVRGDAGADLAARRRSARGGCSAARASITGSEQVLRLELAVGHAALAQQVGAAHLEPREVAAVPGDAHLVGLGVAHAEPRDGRRAHAAASIRPRTARSGVAVAERRGARHHDVGARPRRPAGCSPGSTPPSTSICADRPARADRVAQPPDLVERRGQEASGRRSRGSRTSRARSRPRAGSPRASGAASPG